MRTIQIWAVLAIVVSGLFASCSKEEAPKADQNKDELKLEGEMRGSSWTIPYEDLSDEQKNSYDRIDLTVHENDDFEWKFHMKDGRTINMAGSLYAERSSFSHTNGAGIWNIRFSITHINGQNLPGAFYGIYTYTDENNLVVNVEPDVSNWGKHPTAQNGVGSGEKGMNSVYRYSKVTE